MQCIAAGNCLVCKAYKGQPRDDPDQIKMFGEVKP
jgi:hypothetical protein